MIVTAERTGAEADGQGAGELAPDNGGCDRRAALLTRLGSAVSVMDEAFLESFVGTLERRVGDGEASTEPPADGSDECGPSQAARATFVAQMESAAATPLSGEPEEDGDSDCVPSAEALLVGISGADGRLQYDGFMLTVLPDDIPPFLRGLRAAAGRYTRRYADALDGDVQDTVREAV